MKNVVSTLGKLMLVTALVVPSLSFAEGFFPPQPGFMPPPPPPMMSHAMPDWGGGYPWGGPGYGGWNPWRHRYASCRRHHGHHCGRRWSHHRRHRGFELSLGIGFGGFNFGLNIARF